MLPFYIPTSTSHSYVLHESPHASPHIHGSEGAYKSRVLAMRSVFDHEGEIHVLCTASLSLSE